ncbi:MAG: hypothetical protein U0798_12435 [Gemmataceae bacterium]
MAARPTSWQGQQAILSATSGITGPGVQLVPRWGRSVRSCARSTCQVADLPRKCRRGSAVNAGRGITVGGALSPGFDEQSAHATVTLEDRAKRLRSAAWSRSTLQADSSKDFCTGRSALRRAAFSGNEPRRTRNGNGHPEVTPRLVEPVVAASTSGAARATAPG